MNDLLLPPVHAGDVGSFAPVGAWPSAEGVVYRVWAPDHRKVRVQIQTDGAPRLIELDPDGEGYFSGLDSRGQAGDLYRFELHEKPWPDPASRHQPQGVTGPSQVVDSAAYTWRTTDWQRPGSARRVIYELHVGTFTQEGTFIAAIARLDALVDLGINTIELMPLADFAGERNWGYDGVLLFAPAHGYGTPDELRALVDAAHARGLAVIVDVVYNHIGPSGNVLGEYTSSYFHPERANIWGRALNYDEPAVRRFFLQNACMWFDEYRIDALRLDAVHAIEDDAPRHLAAEIAAAAHARGACVIAEDERNQVRLITPAREGGWGVNALWSDDFHHTVRVALTGERESHFKSYSGSITEWVKTLQQGWFYDGQFFPHWKRARGTPAGHVPPERFVICISNHDQVGNRPLGDRLHDSVSPEAYRAVSMLLCLAPYTPMLFMGQEWSASTPFPYFTDLPGEIGENMGKNRLKEFAHYGADYGKEVLARMPNPQQAQTFASAKLNWEERTQARHQSVLQLYRECLQLRARERIFQSPARDQWSVCQLGPHSLGLRWKDPQGDWLLLVSIAPDTTKVATDDSFMRNQAGYSWQLVMASEEARFGGRLLDEPIITQDLQDLVFRSPGSVLLREGTA